MPEEVAVLMGLVILSGTLVSMGWIITRYLERRGAQRAGVPPDVRQELDEVRERLAAAEERLDFAERLLTRQRDRALPGDE
jgi:hypothetical protein